MRGAAFRAALLNVPPSERDAWVDSVFGIELVDDNAELPRGCVPYLPCGVDALLRVIEHANIGPDDVFVDVGSGLGRAALIVHLLSGARVVGLEVQSRLALASRALAKRLNVEGFTAVVGDAPELCEQLAAGTVFFLYCPFGGARLERMLDGLERVAVVRDIRVCTVDLPLPARRWLRLVAEQGEVQLWRSG